MMSLRCKERNVFSEPVTRWGTGCCDCGDECVGVSVGTHGALPSWGTCYHAACIPSQVISVENRM